MLSVSLSNDPLYNIPENALVSIPVSSNLSYMWNFGSLLGIILTMQIITGILLASLYSANLDLSFTALSNTIETNEGAWLLRYIHINGASAFFMLMYLHIGRGLYYSSFTNSHTWITGVSLLLLSMATAFLGYVLPLNQISFWGASVITSLFSEVPYIGSNLIQYIWGGVSIAEPTLTRFFAVHFLLPFVILALVITHITLLHEKGSSNPLGLPGAVSNIPFHPFFSINDIVGLASLIIIFISLVFYAPLILGDNENFTPANPSSTPLHIQPEWYFLFAYSILRSVPNKFGGVLALAASVLILYSLPVTHNQPTNSNLFLPLNNILLWTIVAIAALLTWIGANPVEPPFIITNQIFSGLYFTFFILYPLTNN